MKILTTLTALTLLTLTGCVSGPNKVSADSPETAVANSSKALAQAAEASRRGDRYFRTGAFDEALFYYSQSARLNASDASVYYKIGYIYDRRGDLIHADQAFGHVLQTEPSHLGALEGRGTIRLKQRDYQTARDLLTRVLEAEPGNVRAHNGLGVIADLDREHTVAVSHFKAALEQSPDSVRTLINLGYSYYLAGNWDRAEFNLIEALRLDADDARANHNLGLLYARKGLYPQAIGQLEKVMSRADAYNDIGYACMLEERFEDAARFFNQSIRLAPRYNEVAHKNLALNRKLSLLPRRAQQDTAATPEREQQSAPAATAAVPVGESPARTMAATPLEPGKTSNIPAADNLPLISPHRWVVANGLRVRKLADAHSAILDKVDRGRAVSIVREDRDWALVRYWEYSDGAMLEKSGWVSSQFLSATRSLRDS